MRHVMPLRKTDETPLLSTDKCKFEIEIVIERFLFMRIMMSALTKYNIDKSLFLWNSM